MTTKTPDSEEKAIHWSAHRDDDIELRCHPERDLFGFQDQARRVADYLAHVFPQLPRGPVTTALQRERSASLTAHGEALGGLEGRRRSVLLSVLGERGAGKSSMMDLIVFEVLEEQRRQDPVCFGSKPPLEVRYNAWINANRPESVWLRVAEHIGEELFNRLRVRLAPPPPGVSRHFLRVTARGPNGEVERQVEVSKVEVRLSWREVALRVSRAVHAAFAEGWGPEFSLFTTPHSYLPGPGLALSLPRAAPGIASRGLALAGALAKDGPSGFLEVAASAVKDTQRMLEEAYVCAAEVPPADSSRFLDLLNTLLDKVGPKPRTGPRIILRLEDVGRLDDRQLREFSAVLPMLERLSGALVFIDNDLSRMTIEGSRAPDSQERPITRLVTLREHIPHELPLPCVQRLVKAMLDAHQWASADERVRASKSLSFYWRKLGVKTPRQVKRALCWVESRLAHVYVSPSRAAQDGAEEEVTALDEESSAVMPSAVDGLLALGVLYTIRVQEPAAPDYDPDVTRAMNHDVAIVALRRGVLTWRKDPLGDRDWDDKLPPEFLMEQLPGVESVYNVVLELRWALCQRQYQLRLPDRLCDELMGTYETFQAEIVPVLFGGPDRIPPKDDKDWLEGARYLKSVLERGNTFLGYTPSPSDRASAMLSARLLRASLLIYEAALVYWPFDSEMSEALQKRVWQRLAREDDINSGPDSQEYPEISEVMTECARLGLKLLT